MKLSDSAKPMGVRDETAWRWFRDGTIPGRRIGPRPSLTEGRETPAAPASQRGAISARVSSAENTSDLDSQAERLAPDRAARGSQVAKVVNEVGSGVDDARPKLLALREDPGTGSIVGEHEDRLPRFGLRSLAPPLAPQSRALAVVNQAEKGTEDVLADLTAIVSSLCARLYGQRRAQRQTEVIVREWEAKGEADATR